MERSSLERLWVLMVTAFVDMVGYALIFPLLPLYADEFGASPTIIGALMASFALAQLVTAPFWGRFSDHFGRRPMILASQILAAIAFVVFALADSVWLLLLSRLAQGAGAGTVAVTQAYVSDVVEPAQRAQAHGWITACTSAGVMIGPAIGSLSLSFTGSEAAPGLIAAFLCVLNIAFAWRWLPEPIVRDSTQPAAQKRPLLQSITGVIRRPARPAHTLIWVYTSGMLAFMAVASVIALYLADRFGVPKERIGYFYVVMGFVSVLMRAFFLGFLVKAFGEVRVLRFGALTLAVGLSLAPLAGSPWLFLLAALAMPTGTALLFPSTTSLISRYAEPGEAGQVHGVQQAFGGASRLLGPLWAGVAYDLCQPSSGLVCGGALPFWIGSGIVALTLLIALRVRPGAARPRLPVPETAEA